MDYEIKDRSIILQKKYIKNKYFLHFLCHGIINQFTYVIDRPRILIYDEQNLLKEMYDKLNNVGLDIWFSDDLDYFNKKVHFCEFDLGIIVSLKFSDIIINFVGGSGDKISQTKFSIIEKELQKINIFMKNGTKSAKKPKKINKIKIKYEKNNKCTSMQMRLQYEKFFNFNKKITEEL